MGFGGLNRLLDGATGYLPAHDLPSNAFVAAFDAELDDPAVGLAG
jgi:hypothetical protein